MITQLAKDKYKIAVDVGYDCLGKRKRVFETFRGNKKDAKLRESEIKKMVKYGDYIKNNNIKFKELNDKYFENYVIPNLSPKTVASYRQLSNDIIGIIGNNYINNITPMILNDMYMKLKSSKYGRKLSNNTMLHYYNYVNGIMKFAVNMELLRDNPNRKIARPKIKKKIANYYTVEEIGQLLNCLKKENLKYQAIIVLALDSGARRSELLGLEWDDLDLKKKCININKSVVSVNGSIINKETKNSSSSRIVYLTDYTIEILKLYKQEQEKLKKIKKEEWGGSNKIFTTDKGYQMHPDTPSKIFRKVLDKYKLRIISFHQLRHTSATLQIALGVNSKLVSKRLGHSTVSTTLNIYSHTYQSMEESIADKINDVFIEKAV